MFESNYELKCKKVIDNIINLVENKSVSQAFKHIVKNEKGGNRVDYNLAEKTLHNITNIYTYLDYLENTKENTPNHIIIIFKLYSYLHCIENKYTYKVIGNLLRLLKRKDVKGDLFDKSNSGIQCFKNLKNSSDLSIMEVNSLFEVWESFIDQNLRNAISHNDYIINDKELIIPSVILDEIKCEPVSNQYSYTFKNINDLYIKANEFQNAFKTIAQKYGKLLGPRY